MSHKMKSALVGVLALSGLALAAPGANATPMQNMMSAAPDGASSMLPGVEKTYLVCGRFHCWHRWGGPRYYHPYWRRGWGWRRW